MHSKADLPYLVDLSRVMGRSRQFAEEQEYAFATFDVKAGQ